MIKLRQCLESTGDPETTVLPTHNSDEGQFVTCPFCNESGFDLIGLKDHLQHGDCEPFNNLEDLPRLY
jgi:hypothetical protein